MKKIVLKSLQVLLLFLITGKISFAQNPPGRISWNQNPFQQKVFIENKGQFSPDGSNAVEKENPNPAPVHYGVVNGGDGIYFSEHGTIYKNTQIKKIDREEWERKERRERRKKYEEELPEPVLHYIHMDWVGANPNVEIVSEEAVSQYFTYVDYKDKTGKSSLKASACKKIIYKNLYPNIDVEYTFPENKPGIKYSLILHPGADVSVIKMKYSETTGIYFDKEGNIHIGTSFGEITDHSPISFYDNHEGISSSFSVNENIVSFKFSGKVDHDRTIIIDPWTTNPNFGSWVIYNCCPNNPFLGPPDTQWVSYNSAYDIDYDLQGNVYVYGACDPFEEIKLNSSGVVQWIFTHPSYAPYAFGQFYGDFAVDHTSGSSYLAQGVGGAGATKIAKLNSAGTIVSYFNGAPNMDEIWRIAFNNCTHEAIIGTANHQSGNPAQAAILDTNVSNMTFVNVLNAPGAGNDPCLLAIDNSNDCFMAIAKSVTGGTFNNMMVKFPANTMTPTAWVVPDGYSFLELLSVTYVNNQVQGANGFNGMAVNNNFLYTYDGSVLKKWDKSTGGLLGNVTVTGSPFNWGGLDVDECDNVFAGGMGVIKQYDVNLNLVNTFSVPDSVFDLKLGPMNKLYACGAGFVSEIQLPASATCNQLTLATSSNGSSCSASTGSASVTVSGGSGNYTYSWNPGGQTSQSISNLSPGNYVVTVIDNSCVPKLQTATVVITSSGSYSVNTTSSNVTCNSGNNGSATATVTGSTSPYTYSWSPSGGANANATGLTAGIYTVTVTDVTGCITQSIVNISQPAAITATTSATSSSCSTSTGTASVSSSGGTSPYTYLWNNGQAVQTATGLSAGAYTVMITDASGCSAVATATVTQPSTISSTAAAIADTCGKNVGSATATASGGNTPYTYLWNTGQSTSAINNISAGNYLVIVSDANGCSVASTVSVTNFGGVTANAGPNVTINLGSSTTISASGGTNYSWSSGETSSAIIVSPPSTTTYTVYVSDASGCSAFAVVTVDVVEPLPDCSNLEAKDLFFLPNAFSPDKSGQNDQFHLLPGKYYYDCLAEFYIAIYNRWGEKVFESSEINFMWDGTYNGKAENSAVFAYYIKAVTKKGNTIKQKGNISLLR